MKEASAILLAPRQLGFRIDGGAEAAVRAARRYIDNMIPGQVLVKIDSRMRSTLCDENQSWKQSLSTSRSCWHLCAQSTLSQASVLHFVDFVLQSAEAHNKVPSRAAVLLFGIQRAAGVSTVRTRPRILRRRGSWWRGRVRHEGLHTTRRSRQTTWARVESQ